MANRVTTILRIGNEPAFTLIELAFVTLALGVLVVSTGPRLQQGWVGLQTERTAFEVTHMLRAARMFAIAEGRSVDWVWDAQPRRICLGTPGATCASEEAQSGQYGQARALPATVSFSVVRAEEPVDHIRFFPDGTSQAATLTIGTAALSRYTITVHETTGQVLLRSTRLPAH